MNSQWLSIVAVLAALMIGYSLLGNRDGIGLDRDRDQPVLLGYYLKDAIITETSESGSPRVRFAASEVTQNTQDNSVTLAAVRADYVWSVKDQAGKQVNAQTNHWVLNADQAHVPARSQQNGDRIELRGNVEAHSVDAPHSTSLVTQSLDIDTGKQIARSAEVVTADLDGHVVNGQGLLVDMQKNQVQLKSNVTLRLAANKPDIANRPANSEPPISLPDLFASDSFAYIDNVMVLTKVRSKTEPFISADQARAMGTDLANNQVVLRGAVRLELPKRGLVTADAATVTVRNSRIVHAQLTGAPVNFQHQRKDSDQLVRGRGATIDYDVAAQTLLFSGESWFGSGKVEFTSQSFEYNLLTEGAKGGPATIVVTPHKDDAAAAESEAPQAKYTKPQE